MRAAPWYERRVEVHQIDVRYDTSVVV
jgi:hypothetical protein